MSLISAGSISLDSTFKLQFSNPCYSKWKNTKLVKNGQKQHYEIKLSCVRSGRSIILTTKRVLGTVQKPNSWTYNFVEVFRHNLESSQTWGFRIQCLHYEPDSPLLLKAGGGGGVGGVKSVVDMWIARRKTRKTLVQVISSIPYIF